MPSPDQLRKVSEALGREVAELFVLGPEEEAKMAAFMEAHEARHGRCLDPTGGRFSVVFTNTSVGTACAVQCACGEKLDATDYDSW